MAYHYSQVARSKASLRNHQSHSIVQKPIIGITLLLSTSWICICSKKPPPSIYEYAVWLIYQNKICVNGLSNKGFVSYSLCINVHTHKNSWYTITKTRITNLRHSTKKVSEAQRLALLTSDNIVPSVAVASQWTLHTTDRRIQKPECVGLQTKNKSNIRKHANWYGIFINICILFSQKC